MKEFRAKENWVACCNFFENAAWRAADCLWPLLIAVALGAASLLMMK